MPSANTEIEICRLPKNDPSEGDRILDFESILCNDNYNQVSGCGNINSNHVNTCHAISNFNKDLPSIIHDSSI